MWMRNSQHRCDVDLPGFELTPMPKSYNKHANARWRNCSAYIIQTKTHTERTMNGLCVCVFVCMDIWWIFWCLLLPSYRLTVWFQCSNKGKGSFQANQNNSFTLIYFFFCSFFFLFFIHVRARPLKERAKEWKREREKDKSKK